MGLRREARLTMARGRGGAPAPLLMLASGFAGLGYQIVWTEQASLWLGHESAAVLAVVAAFFGGLAVGAWALGGRIERSARPVRWYAGCELAIAVWGAALVVLMPPVAHALLRLTGVAASPLWQWTVAFVGTFVLLLPATAAMGATLPAMERLTASLVPQHEGRSVAALYAANTLGAVVGVLATAFWLVPAFGLARTALACAALNFACAWGARTAFAGDGGQPPAATRTAGATAVTVRLALTGLLGIGYELVVGRVLAQITESTVYTFALLLAVYLTGTAAGAAGYERLLRRARARWAPWAPTELLLGALALACAAGAASLLTAERTRAAAAGALAGGVGAALAAEALPALLAFGPATLVMGALFSELSRRALGCGVGLGRAIAVNTLGAALAPLLFGVLLAPRLGAKLTLAAIALAYVAIAPRRLWRLPIGWTAAAATTALALAAPPLVFVDVPPGGRLVRYEEGVAAAVSVVEDADGVARLRIDNRAQEGSSATGRVDGRQAWLPLLLHPAPRRALFLGLGTGVTARAAADDPTLEVDAVELLPEVVRASALFAGGPGASRLNVLTADARRYVRAADRSYDVIVSDNFHPARSGSGALYTVEHFRAVSERLAPEGLFCQWLPLHQLDRATLASVVRSFLVAFPNGFAALASYSLETPVIGLVGRRDDRRFDAVAIRERLARAAASGRATKLGLEDDFAVLGSFVAGPAALARLARGAPANTDDRPIVAHAAPRATYAPQPPPRDRLIRLLDELSLAPEELLARAADASQPARLAAYWAARDRFIRAGRDVRPLASATEMLAQVRAPLLAVLRTSPDFRPAYDPLLAMARALASSDPGAARALLAELARVQPSRSEATQALAVIDARP